VLVLPTEAADPCHARDSMIGTYRISPQILPRSLWHCFLEISIRVESSTASTNRRREHPLRCERCGYSPIPYALLNVGGGEGALGQMARWLISERPLMITDPPLIGMSGF